METLDSMFVHLAVPVASSSALPSRRTSTFSDFYVAPYCHDFANYTVATQRETRKVWVSFHAEYPVFRLDLRENEGNS